LFVTTGDLGNWRRDRQRKGGEAMKGTAMASADDFRRLALAFPGVEEKSHMSHPDFRVGGRIFATLGSPDADHGMVALLPEQQELAIDAAPEMYRPAAGAWGRKGSTLVRLEKVSDAWLERTLRWAWENRKAKNRR
jgi:hypothetical protein